MLPPPLPPAPLPHLFHGRASKRNTDYNFPLLNKQTHAAIWINDLKLISGAKVLTTVH